MDINTWEMPVKKTSSPTALTTYVVRFLTEWEDFNVQGENLFFAFKDEFGDWTTEMFEKIESPFKREFREFFHSNGVYTSKKSMAIEPALVALLREEEFPCWPQNMKSIIEPQQQRNPTAVYQSIEGPEINMTTSTSRLTPSPSQPHLQPQNLTPNLHAQHRSQSSNHQEQMKSLIQFPHQRPQSFSPSYQTPIRSIRQKSPHPWESDQPLPAPNSPYPQKSIVNTGEGGSKLFDDYEDLPLHEGKVSYGPRSSPITGKQ
ncbi:hypothetical protein Golomagni_05621 [Golovinomyces magnicellulatus]|nr:hypothetical protein Golomagni_05621 [Golovinomyces magnicellulatus]